MRIGVLVVMLAAAVVSAKEPAQRRPFLIPSQILKRLEASGVAVRIAGIETLQDVARGRLADETWKELVPPIEYPRVKRRKGTITVDSLIVADGKVTCHSAAAGDLSFSAGALSEIVFQQKA